MCTPRACMRDCNRRTEHLELLGAPAAPVCAVQRQATLPQTRGQPLLGGAPVNLASACACVVACIPECCRTAYAAGKALSEGMSEARKEAGHKKQDTRSRHSFLARGTLPHRTENVGSGTSIRQEAACAAHGTETRSGTQPSFMKEQ